MNRQLLDGKYKIVRELGEGAFGRVILAEDTVIKNRFVAIKVLKNQDHDWQENLVEEMRILANLQNPSIVTFYHHFQDQGQLHLVMEYCAGGSVRKKCRQGEGLNPNDVFQWGVHLTEVFGFVHDQHIVHHDIKPDNLLLTDMGHLKIGDFGVANKNIGTLAYMAPELFSENDVSIQDPRIDIYALGVTLLELIQGHNPLSGIRPDEMLLKKLHGDFVSSELPSYVQEILLKATHSTPELRFQTMKEFQEALTSKTVPLIIDQKRMDAHKQAIIAGKYIKRKKWIEAGKHIQYALEKCPDSVPTNIAAGQLALKMKQLRKAKGYLDRALRLNPRVNIQKELGWINLEMGKYSTAISLLNDHLHRKPLDEEAHNLLIHCFYATDRYELGVDLARQNLDKADCFPNNYFLCRILLGERLGDILAERVFEDSDNQFLFYNRVVITETPKSWDVEGRIPLKSKLLFQDFRFKKNKQNPQCNTMAIDIPGHGKREYDREIITIGRNPSNVITSANTSISRRHCVIVNYPDDVWIYDLESTTGTFINGDRIHDKMFLLGAYDLMIGQKILRLYSKVDILV